ncbi:hypothetical protein [Enterococcus hirae]|uniref:hypothetical protein n=1 Tax=Enterococcus hirae TaxID=1354 RepID=UPI003841B9C4
MKMKKCVGAFFAIISLIVFGACSNNVTVDDLKANDWVIEAAKDDDADMDSFVF